MDKSQLIALTADIVASHAYTREMSKEELLSEIDVVFAKLASLGGTESAAEPSTEAEASEETAVGKPAVPLEAAFGADKVFCMVCGQGMKTLKRHIKTSHDMMPGQYRKAFGIPAGTPLVAKNYSEARKKMAKDLNLAGRLVKARAARKKGKKK